MKDALGIRNYENALFAYAHHRVLRNVIGEAEDYIFIEVNSAFETITGLSSGKVLNKKVSEVLPNLNSDTFNWIKFYGEISKNLGNAEIEQYSETLKKWYRISVFSNQRDYFTTVFIDITKEKNITIDLLKDSYEVLNSNNENMYQKASDLVLKISGAKYVVFNVFEENNEAFSTVAVSGVKSHLKKIQSIFGFQIVGKTWSRDIKREEKMKGKTLVFYDSLSELASSVVPSKFIKFAEYTFNIGVVVLLRVFKDNIAVGDFTLVFEKNHNLKNESLLLIYSQFFALIIDRSRSYKKISNSEQRFNEIAQQTKEIIWEIDSSGVFKYINKVCFDILGYTTQEIINQKKLSEIVKISSKNSEQKTLLDVLNKHQHITDFECVGLTKQNTEKWFLTNAIPILNDKGLFSGYHGAFHDITEDKKNKNELLLLSHAVEQSSASVVITDLSGNVVYVNQMFSKITGYTFEEVQGKNSRILKADKTANKSDLWNVITKGNQWRGEFINRKKNGEIFYESALISPVIDSDGEIVNYIAIKEDITLRKSIELELENKRNQLNSIYDNIQVMVVLVDENNKISYFNREFLKISGLKSDEIIGKSICEAFSCQGNQASEASHMIGSCSKCLLTKNLNDTMQSGNMHRNIEYKIWINRSENKPIKLTFIANTALIQQGENRNVLLCLTDISERKRNEELLKEQLDFQKLISDISALFVNSTHDKMDESINFALQECGKFFAVDRSYVFVFDSKNHSMKNTHEWCKISDDEDFIRDKTMSFDKFPWWKFQAKTKRIVYIDDVHQADGLSDFERNQYKALRIKSLLCIPMINQSEVLGFVGFDTRDNPKIWANDHVSFVGVVVELISRTLFKKMAEESLLLSEEQFQLAVKGNNDGIWDWMINENFLYLSPRWKQIIGYEDFELSNTFETFLSSLYIEDLERVQIYVNSYLDGTISNYDIEFRQVHKNGSVIWIHARGEALRDKKGKPYRMAGSHTDITERKKNEISLQSKQMLLSAIVESTDELLGNNSYLKASEKVIKLLGEATMVDRVYLYQNTYNSNEHPVACEKKMEWKSGQNDTPKKQDFEDYSYLEMIDLISHFNKHTAFWSNSIDNLPDSVFKEILCSQMVKSILVFPLIVEAKFWGFVGFHDCKSPREWTNDEYVILRSFSGTLAKAIERKMLEQKLVTSLESAKQATKAKSEFLSTMSHEIRTPLNGVIGFTDLLMNTSLNPVQLQYMESINLSANSLLDLINDVLDYSKIEAGKLIMNPERTNLHELIEQIVDIVRFSAHRKGLEILLNIPSDCPKHVLIDSVRLRQVLINLMSNAIKFTERGEVELKVEILNATKGDVCLKFSVKDTGIGIPKDKINKILDYFTQADASVTRKYGGSGLGLAIATRILEMMNSKLDISSKLDFGSVFSFIVDVQTFESSKQNRVFNNKIKNVLIVDDNEQNRFILSEMLRFFNISSKSASSGDEAMETLERNTSFNLAIIDYHMPDKDGLTLIDWIRNTKKLNEEMLPIIFLHSSSDDNYINIKCKEYNVNSQIVKPLKMTQLDLAISKINGFKAEMDEKPINKANDKDDEVFSKAFRFLIAEDNLTNMLLAKRILKTILPNCFIFEAKDGNEAVQVFLKTEIDLVFMDIHMPEMSGYESTQLIRENETNKHVPIVALTADTSKDEKEKCFEVGMDDYLSKPIVVNDIKKIVIKYLH